MQRSGYSRHPAQTGPRHVRQRRGDVGRGHGAQLRTNVRQDAIARHDGHVLNANVGAVHCPPRLQPQGWTLRPRACRAHIPRLRNLQVPAQLRAPAYKPRWVATWHRGGVRQTEQETAVRVGFHDTVSMLPTATRHRIRPVRPETRHADVVGTHGPGRSTHGASQRCEHRSRKSHGVHAVPKNGNMGGGRR